MNHKDLDHDFCTGFRDDLKRYGLEHVVTELLTSKSDKLPLKKQYLARECRKKSFAAKFNEALATVGDNNRSLRLGIIGLREEIFGGIAM